jgi:spore coat polysaccharide biosynthesis predicted glycosyltransferase SpsG
MAESAPIVFVARASIKDGLGHLVRTLCVMKELPSTKEALLLALGDGAGRHLIEAAQVPCRWCVSDDDAASEVSALHPETVVFDTLRFDDTSFERIKSAALVASLSPVFNQMHRVDELFHRTEKEDPTWAHLPTRPRIHKGLQFAVLPAWLKRVDLQRYTEHVAEERLAVAISMGGTDAPNRTLQLLKLLGNCPTKLVLYVALGDGYTHSYEELLSCARSNHHEIILLKSNESMWRVLSSCSLVICSGGLTTYEAAFIGLPAVNILQDARWAYLFEELCERGACRTLAPGADCLQQAVELVRYFSVNRADLTGMHRATRGLIPAGGARQIATALNSLQAAAAATGT